MKTQKLSLLFLLSISLTSCEVLSEIMASTDPAVLAMIIAGSASNSYTPTPAASPAKSVNTYYGLNTSYNGYFTGTADYTNEVTGNYHPSISCNVDIKIIDNQYTIRLFTNGDHYYFDTKNGNINHRNGAILYLGSISLSQSTSIGNIKQYKVATDNSKQLITSVSWNCVRKSQS